MKSLLITSITALSIIGSCSNPSEKERIQAIKDGIEIKQPNTIISYSKYIDVQDLKTHLYKYASEEFQGRATGTVGQKKATKYLRDYYLNEQICSPLGEGNYYQNIPKSYLGEAYNDSENVLAFIEGSEKPEEVVVLTAHLDHEGIDEKGNVYYGADDDGSGTVALLEIAQAFKKAENMGLGPKRTILFLHTTAEEIGLYGSHYYTENPIFPLYNTVVNLNVDMIGRTDRLHSNNDSYLYLIGSDRLSKELHYISEAINNELFNIDLDYRFNDENDHNNYYSRSDHYHFAKYDIPVIFYFNGEHEDYHQITDTPDKINYTLLEKRSRLIFATAWQLANQDERVMLD